MLAIYWRELRDLLKSLRFLIANPGNRVLDHRVIEIEVFVFRHPDDRVVLRENGIELAGFASKKAPEIIESQRIRPAIKRSSGSLLRIRRKMPFADRSGIVAIELKSLGD